MTVYNGHVPAIISTPLNSHFSNYLANPSKSPTELDINIPLFTRLLHCDANDVLNALGFSQPLERVDRAAKQLHEAGMPEEADRIILMSAQRTNRPSLLNVTSAFRSLKGFFS